MTKTVFKTSAIAMVLFCLSAVLHAAPPGGPGGDPDPGGTKVPFDFGISILVAAGVGYAAKKKHDAKKKELEADLTEK